MNEFSNTVEYDKHVYIPYRKEYLNDMPYWVYYLEHSKHKPSLHFATRKQFPTDHYRGALNLNETQTSYLFYELKHVDDFTSSDQEVLWKVTPYEMLYTREVAGIPIHPECIQLFKAYPKLCFVEYHDDKGDNDKDDNDKDDDKDLIHEVPVVSYLGVGASEIQEQILLQSNQKVGPLGKGYYFKKYEDALYDAYYKEDTENLIHFENKSHLDDRTIQDDRVVLKGNSFYHGRHYLGDSNACNKNINYSIYYYDEEVIYLKSNKPHHCETEVQLRKESGYVMRYILFLKNHRIGSNPKKGFDSYASDSTYMIKNADHFNCLSYHFIKKK